VNVEGNAVPLSQVGQVIVKDTTTLLISLYSTEVCLLVLWKSFPPISVVTHSEQFHSVVYVRDFSRRNYLQRCSPFL
jgi:hypothetical protein